MTDYTGRQYEVVGLSPDNEGGYQALHEHLQDGWEVVYSYREPRPPRHEPVNGVYYDHWINHALLRRPIQS